jgi:hypothetical protein
VGRFGDCLGKGGAGEAGGDRNEFLHTRPNRSKPGAKGELYRAYTEGTEDQLGALGLVLSGVTLWKTVYLDPALDAGVPGAMNAAARRADPDRPDDE